MGGWVGGRARAVLSKALELVEGCPCSDGCLACVHDHSCTGYNAVSGHSCSISHVFWRVGCELNALSLLWSVRTGRPGVASWKERDRETEIDRPVRSAMIVFRFCSPSPLPPPPPPPHSTPDFYASFVPLLFMVAENKHML